MSLQKIQTELNAPKGQFNSFGKYAYRSCEDILGAVKPLLADCEYSLILNDSIVQVGERVYVRATAILSDADGNNVAASEAYAREPLVKKGMDESQITGTASSYARKYALNGLFAIDDTKDADTDEHQTTTTGEPRKDPDTIVQEIMQKMDEAGSIGELQSAFSGSAMFKKDKARLDKLIAHKDKLKATFNTEAAA